MTTSYNSKSMDPEIAYCNSEKLINSVVYAVMQLIIEEDKNKGE